MRIDTVISNGVQGISLKLQARLQHNHGFNDHFLVKSAITSCPLKWVVVIRSSADRMPGLTPIRRNTLSFTFSAICIHYNSWRGWSVTHFCVGSPTPVPYLLYYTSTNKGEIHRIVTVFTIRVATNGRESDFMMRAMSTLNRSSAAQKF